MVCVQLIAGHFPGVSLRPSSKFRKGTRISLALADLEDTGEGDASGSRRADVVAKACRSTDAGAAREDGKIGEVEVDLQGNKQAVHSVGKPAFHCSKCNRIHPKRHSYCKRCGDCYHHRNLKGQAHHQQGRCVRRKRQSTGRVSAGTPKKSPNSKSLSNGGSPDVGGSTERVKELKKMGNRAMRCLNFDEAIKLYTEAILLCGSASMGPDTRGGECLEVLYANRSSAHHSSGRYEEALADAENCILLQNSSLGHQAKAAALHSLGRLREATQSRLIASLLLREDGAHEASGRCESGSGISTSPSVFDAGGAGGSAECVGAINARGEGRELAGAGEGAAGDLDLEWSGWQQELNTDFQEGAAAGQRKGQFGKKRNVARNSLSTLAAVAVSQHLENGGSENEIWSALHQPLPPPPPPPPGKLTNWDSWRKKTALFVLKEMIIDPCSNHLLIDTRSKADFDRSHAWTAVEVQAFFIPVNFLTKNQHAQKIIDLL